MTITINERWDVWALSLRGNYLHSRDGVAVIESPGIIQSLRRPTFICHIFGTPAILLLIPQNSLRGGALRARRRPADSVAGMEMLLDSHRAGLPILVGIHSMR